MERGTIPGIQYLVHGREDREGGEIEDNGKTKGRQRVETYTVLCWGLICFCQKGKAL